MRVALLYVILTIFNTTTSAHLLSNPSTTRDYLHPLNNFNPNPPDPIENMSTLSLKYGILLDTTVESIWNQKLYQFIDEWMGVTYRYGGKDKNGIDCSNFAAKLVENIYGLQLPPGSKSQYDLCDPLEVSEIKEGDLLFFNTFGGGISHVAVYLGNRFFVHASTRKGVRIDHLEFPYYKKTFLFAGRISPEKTGLKNASNTSQGAN